MTPQELSDRLWQFAARIAKVVDALPETRTGRHVAGQIVRSGTAAAPHYDEARSGESRADFVHNVQVALKDLVETGPISQILNDQFSIGTSEILKFGFAERSSPKR